MPEYSIVPTTTYYCEVEEDRTWPSSFRLYYKNYILTGKSQTESPTGLVQTKTRGNLNLSRITGQIFGPGAEESTVPPYIQVDILKDNANKLWTKFAPTMTGPIGERTRAGFHSNKGFQYALKMLRAEDLQGLFYQSDIYQNNTTDCFAWPLYGIDGAFGSSQYVYNWRLVECRNQANVLIQSRYKRVVWLWPLTFLPNDEVEKNRRKPLSPSETAGSETGPDGTKRYPFIIIYSDK